MNDKGYSVFTYFIDEKITIILTGPFQKNLFLTDLKEVVQQEVSEDSFIGIGTTVCSQNELSISLK
ncbi:hypothetical protein RYX56_24685, partial [Alkalihalophilus lindianensis]